MLAHYNYNGLAALRLSLCNFWFLLVFPEALPHIVRLVRRPQYQFTRSS